MKSIITAIILATIASISAFAQIDVKTLNGMSDAQIKNIFGTPTNYIFGGPDEDCHFYYYSNVTIVLTDQERTLVSFKTDSPKYCILTKYIPGGIKVGDSLSKLQSIDFSKVDYGRNDPENALSSHSDPVFNYVIFKNEYQHISFKVEGGIIKKWFFTTEQDANPNKTFINFWE